MGLVFDVSSASCISPWTPEEEGAVPKNGLGVGVQVMGAEWPNLG